METRKVKARLGKLLNALLKEHRWRVPSIAIATTVAEFEVNLEGDAWDNWYISHSAAVLAGEVGNLVAPDGSSMYAITLGVTSAGAKLKCHVLRMAQPAA